ncbi:MAG: oligoendopeptidase F [Clostridiales bacterium]|nr:oligoendopeptidase F [Clostridiales bacterium]
MAKLRSEVSENLKWDLTGIFKNDEEFKSLLKTVEQKIDFSKYEGKLGDEKALLDCLKYMDEIDYDLEKVSVYAFMKKDLDTRDSVANALNAMVETVYVKYAQAVSFITPELTSLSEEYLKGVIANPDFKDYDYSIKCILDKKPHVLSRESENLLALGGQVFGGFHDIFTMIDNADMTFPEIEVKGEKIKLSHGAYSLALQSDDRELREKAFKAYYSSYIAHINTIAATYIGNVNKDVFLSRARKYDSCLSQALSAEDVNPAVYENLLESINDALPLVHRYVKDRKDVLGVDELHMYDIYTPLVENADIKLDYEDAFKLVKEGLAPLGEDYANLLQRAHDERWIDVEETEGKRSGAYSVCVYALEHPFVLLNYQPTSHDVFTIAHELGHSMHSYKSDRAQAKAKADYKIFVAEVASTVNEVLLLKHLLKKTEDKKLKKYLLSYYMDMIRTTAFRQTMFAEFEFIAHDAAEKGQPLTKDWLNEQYLSLNKKYYGNDIVSDSEIAYEWARIPHFYRGFYVYKYATGIISAISIAERIYNEGEKAVEDYFKFLSSGGSDSPVELLKLAGVELTKKDAFKSAMKSFEDALTEFENL